MSCSSVKNCPCPKKGCENNGTCCACVAHHRDMSQLPFCFFPKEGDKSYKLFCEYVKEKFA